jgi:FKBP-type peptidyl-prolyl cis-trans isomerase (trigger factor)
MWSEEGGQKKVSRAMTSRGLHGTMKELTSYLKEHLHPEAEEETLAREGADGAARLLLHIAGREGPESRKRKRIEELFEQWAERYSEDRALLKRLATEEQSDPADILGEIDLTGTPDEE